jgi:alpha-beta hydrolase superfamily lysophospholipase
MIDRQEGRFKAYGGLDLYYQHWQPKNEVQAIVAIVHGLGGHSDNYDNLVRYLIPKNYAVYGFDLRGHGRSPGETGYINTWTEYREDLGIFLELIRGQQPTCPLFLFGHSVGAAIAIEYLAIWNAD